MAWINRLLLLATLLSLSACARAADECPSTSGVSLQVLGSGGPIADDARASSGYIVWIDGKSRVLIDAGGGTFLRFGEAGASFKDLSFVGLSHLHTDHSADFPALLKSGNFSGRESTLNLAGTDGAGDFPGLKDWLSRMLSKQAGAYAYLSGYLDGTRGLPMLVPREVSGENSQLVYKDTNMKIEAMHVPHGIVPAVAFKIEVKGETLVFASDQNGSNASFTDFARDTSLLVMHLVVPEDVSGVGRRLHAPPSVIGRVAGEARADTLVLSHFMARSLRDLDANVALVREGYAGKVLLAEDLLCVNVQVVDKSDQ
jgi:ribonuclease BN (tRNA processing enzyme)